jgi:hypothetical protein
MFKRLCPQIARTNLKRRVKDPRELRNRVRLAPHINPGTCLFGAAIGSKCFRMMAGTTGLEPATSAVTE